MAQRLNIAGQKFGKLTAVDIHSTTKHQKVKWNTVCECQRQRIVISSALKNGEVTDCGICQKNSDFRGMNLVGQKFNMLTVLEKTDNIGVDTAWICLCDCGQKKTVRTVHLRHGRVKACGCQMNYNKVNLIGTVAGRWTVVEKMGVKNGHRHYLCQCECGNIGEIDGTELTSGSSKSCGCLQRELAVERGQQLIGELNPCWRGGITAPRQKKHYTKWRNFALKRDKCCQTCGSLDKLEVHHLWAVATYPEKIFDNENSVVLCDCCHDVFHHLYGAGENTPDQFHQFKQDVLTNKI